MDPLKSLASYNVEKVLRFSSNYYLLFFKPKKFWNTVYSQSDKETAEQLSFHILITLAVVFIFFLSNVSPVTGLKNLLQDIIVSIIFIFTAILLSLTIFKKYHTPFYRSTAKQVLVFVLYFKLLTYPLLLLMLFGFDKLEEINLLFLYNICTVILVFYVLVFSNIIFFKNNWVRIFASITNILVINLLQWIALGLLISSAYSKKLVRLDMMDPMQKENLMSQEMVHDIKSVPKYVIYHTDLADLKRTMNFAYTTSSYDTLIAIDFNYGNAKEIDRSYKDSLNQAIHILDSATHGAKFEMNRAFFAAKSNLFKNILALLNDPLDSSKYSYKETDAVMRESSNSDTLRAFYILPWSNDYLAKYYREKDIYETNLKAAYMPIRLFHFLNFYQDLITD
jgi:hypothetical protein